MERSPGNRACGRILSPISWFIVGQRTYEEDHLRISRSWLKGRDTGRDALCMQFAAPGQVMESVLPPGISIDADLAFFPGASPMRALVKERRSSNAHPIALPSAPDFASMLERYSDALAHTPWIPVYPAAIASVVPVCASEVWSLRDRSGHALPLSRQFDQSWKLLGISGGHPVDLFAEWDGETLLPLSVWSEHRLITLT